jgi:L-cysteate sulfo-lyase
MKRDDGIGPGLGGNKGRKLEFLMGAARQQGRRIVSTFGGLQSNHARMTAAACAQLGMTAHLFFFERRPPALLGNLQLNQLLGARMHFIPFGGGDASMTIETTIGLVRLLSIVMAGPGAYYIPVGGHNVVGCLGYVEAAVELHQQVTDIGLDPNQVVVITAVGTGGTLAGLMAGLAMLDSPLRLLGIDVGKLWKAFPISLARLASRLCAHLGQANRFQAADVPIIEEVYSRPGYGRFSPMAAAAIRRLAQLEGILLDPIYSGKAFAGLLDMIGDGRFGRGPLAAEHIIFLHTGGLPGLWAQADQLAASGYSGDRWKEQRR